MAAEVSAETFAKAFQNINRFDYRGIPVKVWLYRIASNEINLYFRNKKNIPLYLQGYNKMDSLRSIFKMTGSD